MSQVTANESTPRFVAAVRDLFSFEVYKRTQGRRLRLLTCGTIGLFVGWGLLSISERLKLVAAEDWPGWLPAPQMAAYWVPGILLAVTAWAVFRIVNWPRFADFLIATEAEMTKVSWSTKDELVRATTVVLAAVFLLAAFLLAMDVIWHWILVKIGVVEVPEAKQALLDWRSLPAAWDSWLKSWS